MYSSLSRAVLLSGTICFGFCSFFIKPTFADDWELLNIIPMIAQNAKLRRHCGGYVRLNNGIGLENVQIYDGTRVLATTSSNGYYAARLLPGMPYTLTPKKSDYQFVPPSIRVSGGIDHLHGQDFTAQETPYNYVAYYLIPDGPFFAVSYVKTKEHFTDADNKVVLGKGWLKSDAIFKACAQLTDFHRWSGDFDYGIHNGWKVVVTNWDDCKMVRDD